MLSSLEKHPYPPFLPQGMKTLFVGSFPPIKLTRKPAGESDDPLIALYNNYLTKYPLNDEDIDFYYGSASNSFWKILSHIFNISLQNKQQIKDCLERWKIGVTDVAEECVRKVIDRKTGKKELPSKLSKPWGHYTVSSSDTCLSIHKQRYIREDLTDYADSIECLIFTGSFAYRNFIKSQAGLNTLHNGTIKLSSRKPVAVYLLPSPSGAANMSIGACKEYKRRKENDPCYNTFRYRLERYRDALKRPCRL